MPMEALSNPQGYLNVPRIWHGGKRTHPHNLLPDEEEEVLSGKLIVDMLIDEALDLFEVPLTCVLCPANVALEVLVALPDDLRQREGV